MLERVDHRSAVRLVLDDLDLRLREQMRETLERVECRREREACPYLSDEERLRSDRGPHLTNNVVRGLLVLEGHVPRLEDLLHTKDAERAVRLLRPHRNVIASPPRLEPNVTDTRRRSSLVQ